MAVAPNPTPADRHAALAEQLGITRDEAKLTNLAMSYLSQPLGKDRGTAFNILRCHEVCRIYPTPSGAAKWAKWEWLAQGQPFDLHTAFHIIRKFIPFATELNNQHPLTVKLRLKDRITMARGIAVKATGEEQLVKIEELLRPLVYILEKEGHRLYE